MRWKVARVSPPSPLPLLPLEEERIAAGSVPHHSLAQLMGVRLLWLYSREVKRGKMNVSSTNHDLVSVYY